MIETINSSNTFKIMKIQDYYLSFHENLKLSFLQGEKNDVEHAQDQENFNISGWRILEA